MSDKQRWILALGGGSVMAMGLGGLIFWQHGRIEAAREEIAVLESQITDGRKLVAKTPELEREVILQRETDAIIREILPNDDDVINFARTLRDFEEKSGVQMYYVQEATVNDREKRDFRKVSYDVKFEGDAFESLAFIDLVESHPRFMSVPHFKLTAMRRSKLLSERDMTPKHNVVLNVETYVYQPKSGAELIKIDGYGRKRDLLLSEISRRAKELTIEGYDFVGPRGRRDPWVDPRVPKEEGPQLTIEQQIALVDELIERMGEIGGLWGEVRAATSLIEESMKRQALEKAMAELEEEIRRVDADGLLQFIPSQRRFTVEVVTALEDVRNEVAATEGTLGPSLEHLQEVADAMQRHLEAGEPQLALDAFNTIGHRLELAERYPDRRPWVDRIRAWAQTSEAFIEFEQIELVINGVLIHQGLDPVAVINGTSVGVGEMLQSGVLVRSIGHDEIEFIYGGVIFSKAVGP